MQNEAIKVRPAVAVVGTAADLDVPITNPDASGCDVVIDITTHNPDGSAGQLTVTVQGVDEVSGKKYTILASAALAATATTVLRIGRGLTAAANVVANSHLPKKLNINLAHGGNAHPMIYTVGMNLIR